MDRERWDHIQAIFHQVSNCKFEEQDALLRLLCDNDADVSAEVQAMLDADRGGESLLDRGLSDVAYRMIGIPFDENAIYEFGPYRLQKILGEGGMGVVWLARRADTGHLVAIKFLPNAALSPARRNRFAQEIRTLAKLRHPYIARLYDAGTLVEGTPWFVMEYVEGVPLSEYLTPHHSVREKLSLFRKLCDAVQYAHGQEIIHRDLKPSNILVERDGTPRLLDFGIAKELHNLDSGPELTRPELRFLSRDYAAPEWIEKGEVGLFTDVYSLGVILYEMLAQQLPREQPAKPSVLAQSQTVGPPISKAAWKDLDVLCLKAIHREPQGRYQSVETLGRDVDHFLKSEPLDAQPDNIRYRLVKFVGRNRGAVLAAAGVLALIIGLTVFYTIRLARERNAALAEANRTEQIRRFMLSMFGPGDQAAGPSNELRVVTLLDRGVREARALNQDPETQGDLYETLGEMYRDLGRFPQAESILKDGLHKLEFKPGPASAKTGKALVELGILRGDEVQPKEAELLVRRGLNVIRQNAPHDDDAIADATSALARVLMQSGKYEKTIALLSPLTRHTPSGEQNTRLFSINLAILGIAHFNLGHYDTSVALTRRALAIDRKVFGENHPRIAEDFANLATVENVQGRPGSAEALFRQAEPIMEAWYGPEHSETVQLMSFIAAAEVQQRKDAEAGTLLRKVLTIQEKNSPNNPATGLTLDNLGKISRRQGDLIAAEKYFRRALNIMESGLGDRDYSTAIVRADLGGALVDEAQYGRAEPLFRQAIAVLNERQFPGNSSVGAVRFSLGRALLGERRYHEAEAALTEAESFYARQPQPNRRRLAEIDGYLLQIHKVLNQPESLIGLRPTAKE